MIDVVTDVFLVGENLVNSGPRPLAPEISVDASDIENIGDLTFRFPPLHEVSVDPADVRPLVIGPRDEHDSVGLNALLFSQFKDALCIAVLVDQHATQSVACCSPLPVAHRDKPTGALKDLGG